jgi:TatD DNase family protein
MKYFDAHCHVQFAQYDEDRDAVVAAMREKDIGGLVVGCDAASSRAAAEFVQDKEGFYASVGQHPNDNHTEPFDEHLYRNLLMYPKVVAIGECGLDYFRPTELTIAEKARQKELFMRHIRLAGATRRPLIVHARPSKGTVDAYDDALAMLAEAKREFGDALTGDFHFFVGNEETAKAAYDLGFTVSFTAVVTFARDYDGVIKNAPLDRLLSETDSPYVAPSSRRGQRNDPTSVIEVVEKLAEIRGEDLETVREATVRNAEKLFKLADYA